MKELLLATTNKGKIAEIEALFTGMPFSIVGLSTIADRGPDVEEPAMTFEGNAIIKAMTWGMRTGKLTLAEDSGIEVDALGGKPGVHSARYADGSDVDRNKKILDEMKNISDADRGAQFHAVAALYDPASGRIRTCEGICRGRILHEPQGENGFGYDPIFYSDLLKKTTAEATMEEKNSVSHRGRALAKVKEILLKEFAS